MDIRIQNNDICLKSGGIPDMIEGFEEIVQKITLACTVRRGRFIYDRDMGAFDTNIRNLSDESAEMLINESLVNTGCSVKVNGRSTVNDSVCLDLTIYNGFENYDTEVMLNG